MEKHKMVGRNPAKKNPKRTREEVVLGFAAYCELRDRGAAAVEDEPEVSKLSQDLQLLPFHELSRRAPNFRNPEGVGRRLRNFALLDAGRQDCPSLFVEVWGCYRSDRGQLVIDARGIRGRYGLPRR